MTIDDVMPLLESNDYDDNLLGLILIADTSDTWPKVNLGMYDRVIRTPHRGWIDQDRLAIINGTVYVLGRWSIFRVVRPYHFYSLTRKIIYNDNSIKQFSDDNR